MMAVFNTELNEMTENMVQIDKLPDDCLAHIFSFLPISDRLIIERVCKRWHGVSAKGWYHTRDINLPEKFSKKQVHVILKRCGRFLKKLNITIGKKCIDCLPMIFKFCQLKCLEDFHVTYRHLHDKSERNSKNLIKFFKESTELRSIKIEGMLEDDREEFSNLLDLRNLRKLEITNNYGDNEYSSDWVFFEMKLHEYPNLNELSFYGVTLRMEDEKNYEPSKNPLKGLETLKMKDCDTTKEFFKILKFFTNLKTLDLSSAFGMAKEDLSGIAKNCQNLVTLRLRECDWIENCFDDLGSMPSLMTLGFTRRHSTSDGMTLNYLTNVETVEIYTDWDRMRNYDGLFDLITHSVKLQNLKFYVHAGIECVRSRITNIFVQGLRTIPLHLTIRIVSWSSGKPNYSYDGPEHPLLEVTVHDRF